jgi:hypothetical protein
MKVPALGGTVFIGRQNAHLGPHDPTARFTYSMPDGALLAEACGDGRTWPRL